MAKPDSFGPAKSPQTPSEKARAHKPTKPTMGPSARMMPPSAPVPTMPRPAPMPGMGTPGAPPAPMPGLTGAPPATPAPMGGAMVPPAPTGPSPMPGMGGKGRVGSGGANSRKQKLDDKLDKKMGIKEGSPADEKMDSALGIKDGPAVGRGGAKAPKCKTCGKRHAVGKGCSMGKGGLR